MAGGVHHEAGVEALPNLVAAGDVALVLHGNGQQVVASGQAPRLVGIGGLIVVASLIFNGQSDGADLLILHDVAVPVDAVGIVTDGAGAQVADLVVSEGGVQEAVLSGSAHADEAAHLVEVEGVGHTGLGVVVGQLVQAVDEVLIAIKVPGDIGAGDAGQVQHGAVGQGHGVHIGAGIGVFCQIGGDGAGQAGLQLVGLVHGVLGIHVGGVGIGVIAGIKGGINFLSGAHDLVGGDQRAQGLHRGAGQLVKVNQTSVATS